MLQSHDDGDAHRIAHDPIPSRISLSQRIYPDPFPARSTAANGEQSGRLSRNEKSPVSYLTGLFFIWVNDSRAFSGRLATRLDRPRGIR